MAYSDEDPTRRRVEDPDPVPGDHQALCDLISQMVAELGRCRRQAHEEWWRVSPDGYVYLELPLPRQVAEDSLDICVYNGRGYVRFAS